MAAWAVCDNHGSTTGAWLRDSLLTETNLLVEPQSARYNSFYYGLQCPFDYLDHFCWLSHRRNCEAVDAGKRSRWLRHHDFARHRRCIGWYLDRSLFLG